MIVDQNALVTRQDLCQAAAALLQPLTDCMTAGKARIFVSQQTITILPR